LCWISFDGRARHEQLHLHKRGFATITGMSNDQRLLQLALKLYY
jgi:hypothetical protein